ncbi:hypothetical protein BJQ89_01392 [Arthrobacter sp. ES1]|nr:hypothetical protein [Arthrobacter sp. ES1]
MASWLRSEQAFESDVGKTFRPSLAIVGSESVLLLGDGAGEGFSPSLPEEDPPAEHDEVAASTKRAANAAATRLPEDICTHAHDEAIAGGCCA